MMMQMIIPGRVIVLIAIFGLVVIQPQLKTPLKHGGGTFPIRRQQHSSFLQPFHYTHCSGTMTVVEDRRRRRRSELIEVMSFKGDEGISENDGSRDGRARQLRRLSRKDPEKVVELLIEALRTNVYNDGNIEPYECVTQKHLSIGNDSIV
mmetsp:Transcript_30719/g.42966  ORF Transcript_30719/g.42966 Transcript_30719/m.42966 type:complete len:150 (+) Transcript_30719:80-529(+)